MNTEPAIERARILIVDDDEPFRTRLAQAFSSRDYQALSVANIEDARDAVSQFMPTHAVVDLHLKTQSGLDLIPLFLVSKIKSVVLTGYGSVATALEAVRLGAINYLAKPVGVEELSLALFGPPLAQTGLQPEETEAVPSLTRVEWEHIQRVLRDCGGNITRAAKKLGLHRQALQRKLKHPPPS